mgnify:CR=1 FL=1
MADNLNTVVLSFDGPAEIIAHRGAAGLRPENTLASVEKAIEDGADWIEIDVQETADGQIRPARNHLWAEPVQEGVRAFLAAEISAAYGRDILPLDPLAKGNIIRVRIDQLHGTLDGHAKLVAYWSLTEGDQTLVAEQFADTLPIGSDGYAALAEAQKSLLGDLARNIAAQLK